LTLWRLRDPSSLHARSWDDGVVLFHAPSGDTHLLDPLAGAALLLLREGPLAVEAMVRASGGRADEALVERLLAELEGLGVVERA
jgi:PqqD family protein of HPr-rel-A system